MSYQLRKKEYDLTKRNLSIYDLFEHIGKVLLGFGVIFSDCSPPPPPPSPHPPLLLITIIKWPTPCSPRLSDSCSVSNILQ
jgi:hypothetical protein